mmetsp:Transcript_6453/g.12140  ORF Transcript_6453/g.12140 Transcript_6453/m.12140 type:complete len:594 (-) Transcript_6453:140-1921(-)
MPRDGATSRRHRDRSRSRSRERRKRSRRRSDSREYDRRPRQRRRREDRESRDRDSRRHRSHRERERSSGRGRRGEGKKSRVEGEPKIVMVGNEAAAAEKEKARSEDADEEKYRREVAAQLEVLDDDDGEEDGYPQPDVEDDVAAKRRKRWAQLMTTEKPSGKAAAGEKKKKDVEGEDAQPAEPHGNTTTEEGVAELKKEGGGGDLENSDEDDDMFNTSSPKAKGEGEQEAGGKAHSKGGGSKVDDESFTDLEGYYIFRPGDVLNGRFFATSKQGRGTFSTVLRVKDQADGDRECVIKVIRNNEYMKKKSLEEMQKLVLLTSKDPEGKRNCVRLFSHFEQRGHLCMVFEPMLMNLREYISKRGGRPLEITDVRSMGFQLLRALSLCKRCGLIHADLKPDNLLIGMDRKTVKLSDFGSSLHRQEVVRTNNGVPVTSLIGSMGYRAPEILAGISLDFPCDIWSAGATLCELLTGKILYKGTNDNQMLLLQMELCGNFPKKLVKRAAFREKHFGSDGVFLETKVDPLSKVELRVPRPDLNTPIKSFEKDVLRHVAKAKRKKRAEFANLLAQMFIMDPSKRPNVKECMKHSFFHSSAQ